jgi:glycine dehydrogenase subunit 1
MGKEGLRELAAINAAKAAYARERLSSLPGFSLPFDAPVFNEFVLECPMKASDILNRLAEKDILGGVDLGRWYPNLDRSILICTTEMNTREEIDRFAKTLSEIVR